MLGLEVNVTPTHRLSPCHSCLTTAPWLTETLQPDPAQILLRDFRWNKDQLIDKYLEDPDTAAVNSGLVVPAPRPAPEPTKPSGKGLLTRSSRKVPSSAPSSQTSSQTSQEPFECPICCDGDPRKVMALKCGHRFCSECWQAYIQNKIRQEGECNIRCANTDCVLVVPSKFIYDIMDKGTAERFDWLILRHYVDNMARLKYCPAPECTYTISCPAAASKASLVSQVPSVTCPEGHTFCFGCSIDSDHRPVVCTVAKLWLKKCQDDSETANWIKTNTKECTKCQSTIEKNGGCK
jgi:ariadne-1